MNTFLKTETKRRIDIEIHSMTSKGYEVKTCTINDTDIYEITVLNEDTLKTYTGKIIREIYDYKQDPNYPTSLELFCYEASKIIIIDIKDIKDIQRYSKEISNNTIIKE